MASENVSKEGICSFVREDSNEEFEVRPERICPDCNIDRKTLALACVSDNHEDRAAARSITGSCPQCREAMADIVDELQKRQEARRQAHCSRCGSRMVELSEEGLHCWYCGHIAYASEPLPYVQDHPQHYEKRQNREPALVR